MYKKLGISVDEQKMMNNVAMDIVVDSVSVAQHSRKQVRKESSLYWKPLKSIQN
jgi:Fe-S cluster assembly protein SufB